MQDLQAQKGSSLLIMYWVSQPLVLVSLGWGINGILCKVWLWIKTGWCKVLCCSFWGCMTILLRWPQRIFWNSWFFPSCAVSFNSADSAGVKGIDLDIPDARVTLNKHVFLYQLLFGIVFLKVYKESLGKKKAH